MIKMDQINENELRAAINHVFLDDLQSLPLFSMPELQEVIDRRVDYRNLLHVNIQPLATELVFERDLNTGNLIDYKEARVNSEITTAKSSVSLSRRPNAASDIMGNPTNLPFRPPTIEKVIDDEELAATPKCLKSAQEEIFNLDNLMNKIPGLGFGIAGLDPPSDEIRRIFAEDQTAILDKYINDEDISSSIKSTHKGEIDVLSKEELSRMITDEILNYQSLDKELDDVLRISEVESKDTLSSEWVEKLDVNEKLPEFAKLFPNPAFTYPFELDTFQKQALQCLERHDNVFVAAHTSAGKTVVAEYAIAMSIRRNMTRVIYTSPIKALSNQKFRDFQQTYGVADIGIITGDVQIQPEAPCLIMTTEILLQMLYNGSDVIRDLEWVIFDEVHYCNDPSRGHVWEEVFIMLPEHVSLVLLSATVNNVEVYADWLGRTRNKKTFVISTTKRPVPLEHYIYTGTGSKGKDEMFLFVDQHSKFNEIGYKKAMEARKETETKRDKAYGRRALGFQAEKNFFINVVRHLEKNDKLPVIVFTLNRKRCDQNALVLSECMDLTTANEKGTIHKYIRKSLMKLKPVDRQIPQVMNVIEMLKKGFGVHHSGILPILKEITEILFQDGLVRVLFATETFAMGVNMPARSVAFDSIDKHDGTTRRSLLASEYIQMAGRAGRRGKDKTGTVLVLCKQDVPEASILHNMALGKPAPLISQFRLTYSMILNLIRARHHLNVESVMERSFTEHDKQKSVADKMQMKKVLQRKIEAYEKFDCELCKVDIIFFAEHYLCYKEALAECSADLFQAWKDRKLLNPGRLLLLENSKDSFALGVFLEQARGLARNAQPELTVLTFSIDSLLNELHSASNYQIANVSAANVHLLLCKQLNINSINIMRERNYDQADKEATKEAIVEAFDFFSGLAHEMDLSTVSSLLMMKAVEPITDLKLNSIDFVGRYDQVYSRRNMIISFSCIICPEFRAHFNKMKTHAQLKRELDTINYHLSPASMKYLPEYQQRVKVLERLGYVNEQGYLEMKGRVACLFSEHELLLTELLLSNHLSSLAVEEMAAIMSGFVFQQKLTGDAQPKLTDNLDGAMRIIKELATNIGLVQQECQMKEAVGDFVDSVNFGLVEVAYEWAKGTPFNQLVMITEVQEGIIVRTIQRLDEILGDVKQAAKLFGDPTLADRVEAASRVIRRDIVFAASLYTSQQTADVTVDTGSVRE